MVHKVLSTVLIFSFCSCSAIWSNPDSQAGDSTEVSNTATGALTGAAVGGGLGLLVGSTSGAVGEGLIVGSLAGGALGAGIGAQLDSEKGEVKKHQENIIEQDETIKNQDIEIRKLKKNTTDTSKLSYPSKIKANNKEKFKGEDLALTTTAPTSKLAASPRARLASNEIVYLSKPSGARKAIPYSHSSTSVADTLSGKKIAAEPLKMAKLAEAVTLPKKEITKVAKDEVKPAEQKIAKAEKAVETKMTVDSSKKTTAAVNNLPAAATETTKEASSDVSKANSTIKFASQDDCKQSAKEAERGLSASSDADRLFYLRRASRLCPQEGNYHVELGKIYSSIGKNDDAKYEFRQAIDLDSENQVARDELSIIENAGSLSR